MNSDFEHLQICFLAIGMSFFVKCLFELFVYFLKVFIYWFYREGFGVRETSIPLIYAFIGWFFFKDFIYLFLERGREGEREEEKHQCVITFHVPPTGDLARNPGMCPAWESSQRPFGSQASTQSTEPHQPGPFCLFFKNWLLCYLLLFCSSSLYILGTDKFICIYVYIRYNYYRQHNNCVYIIYNYYRQYNIQYYAIILYTTLYTIIIIYYIHIYNNAYVCIWYIITAYNIIIIYIQENINYIWWYKIIY